MKAKTQILFLILLIGTLLCGLLLFLLSPRASRLLEPLTRYQTQVMDNENETNAKLIANAINAFNAMQDDEARMIKKAIPPEELKARLGNLWPKLVSLSGDIETREERAVELLEFDGKAVVVKHIFRFP